ncbi:hypothetical protein Tco_1300022 [Tanacetum coccineum]
MPRDYLLQRWRIKTRRSNENMAMEMDALPEYIVNDVWKNTFTRNSCQIQAVEKERKAKNILLMAIPKEHMRRFHGMDDAKEIWEAIRTRFGGNANSKKMQKAVFKQQFEAFKISSPICNTMRTKPEVDTLSIDDLYNNLRVFEQEIQGASKTSSSAQNVAFVSQSKSSTNKVKSGFTGAYSTCTPSNKIPEKKFCCFATEDIEEMDINWQIAMIAIRMKKFYKKTGRRVLSKGTHDGKKKRDSFYQHQEAGKQEKNQMGLLIMDDGIVKLGRHTKVKVTNHALKAIQLSNRNLCVLKLALDSI